MAQQDEPATPVGEETHDVEQVITPWAVQADSETGVDYEKLQRDWGAKAITPELLARFERVTGHRPHPMLRRGLYFSHRDLDRVLDCYERGEKFFLYTGRGPSSDALHIGHMIPFMFTQWLQEVFAAPLVVQLTDDEKFLWKDLTLPEADKLARENAKDIVAFGFDVTRTFMFQNTRYMGEMYRNVLEIQKRVTYSTATATFGFDGQSNIGKVAFPAIQAAPSFASSFPRVLGVPRMRCLIPCAIDQDPYFRVTRQVAPRMPTPLGVPKKEAKKQPGEYKPALLHCKFITSLQGPGGKMSASIPNSAVFVTDTPKQIKAKVMRAFSGGQEKVEDQRRLGADIEKDVAIQYLRFFLDDDEELASIETRYAKGELLSGEVKQRLAEVITPIVQAFQRRRANVTDEMVEAFMSVRQLDM
ncbi:MAG: hypothetical protein MHM6MM_005266 [Cercozoa sp. M6MM]